MAPLAVATRASTLECGTDCDVPGGLVTVPVVIAGAGETSALQLDILYDPADLTLSGDLVGGPALADHVLGWNEVGAGLLRVLVYSDTSASLLDGTLFDLSFEVEPGATASLPLDLPPVTIIPGYDGPGVILASVGALKSTPDPEPVDGAIDVVEITHPADLGACIGDETAEFTAGAIPEGDSYQWFEDDVLIDGATSDTYLIPLAEPPLDQMPYHCEITNLCGTFVTDVATLTVEESACAPQNPRAYDPGTGAELFAEWDLNPSSYVDAYRLYWGETPATAGGWVDLPVAGGTSLDGLVEGVPYYFRASAWVAGYEGHYSPVVSAIATPGGLELPQAPDYGYQTAPSNDTSHPDMVTYRFPPRGGDVTVWFRVYDVETDEVAILLNGQEVLRPAPTGPFQWSIARTVLLSGDEVRGDRFNVFTVDNLFHPPGVEEAWGVRQVSIKLPAPAVTATAWNQTVDLYVRQSPVEPNLQGYDIHRATVSPFTPSASNRIAEDYAGPLYRDDDEGLGLDNDQTYYYLVRPMDTIDNRGFDSEVDAATPNASDVTPVMDLRVAKSGANDLQLDWSPVTTSDGVQHYVLYEGATPAGVGQVGTETGTSILRTGDQSDGLDHYYTVKVVDNLDRESSR
jgi:hypothetical protein